MTVLSGECDSGLLQAQLALQYLSLWYNTSKRKSSDKTHLSLSRIKFRSWMVKLNKIRSIKVVLILVVDTLSRKYSHLNIFFCWKGWLKIILFSNGQWWAQIQIRICKYSTQYRFLSNLDLDFIYGSHMYLDLDLLVVDLCPPLVMAG